MKLKNAIVKEALGRSGDPATMQKVFQIIDDFIDHYKKEMQKSEAAHGAYLGLNVVKKVIYQKLR